MGSNSNKFTFEKQNLSNQRMPQPGEIWEVNRSVKSPVEFSGHQQHELYSEVAKKFLAGNSLQCYVIIVTDVEHILGIEEQWKILSVMLLSEETQFLSNVDLLLPSEISGLGRDLLAQTWLVEKMLSCNLLQPVGKRLPRKIYDLLLDVGDYEGGLVDKPPPISEIERSQLKIGNQKASGNPEIQAFHQHQLALCDVLSIPVAAYHTYLKGIKLTEAILDEILKVKQDLVLCGDSLGIANAYAFEFPMQKQVIDNIASSHTQIREERTLLSSWLENINDINWQICWELPSLAISDCAHSSLITTRNASNSQELNSHQVRIAALVKQIYQEQDEHQRQKAAQKLEKIAVGNADAIQALVNLIGTTQDDRALWTAADCLWKIDPGNSIAGVRRVKLFDLGIQAGGETVALAVGLVPTSERRMAVRLQVYPTNTQKKNITSLRYLPPGLKLILLSESGENLREVVARESDIYIQLRFSGQVGEKFSVRVALREASITEDFEI